MPPNMLPARKSHRPPTKIAVPPSVKATGTTTGSAARLRISALTIDSSPRVMAKANSVSDVPGAVCA